MKQFLNNMHRKQGKIIVIVFLATISLLLLIIGGISNQVADYHTGWEYIIKTGYDLDNIRKHIQQNPNQEINYSLEQKMDQLMQNIDSIKPIANHFPVAFLQHHRHLKQKLYQYCVEAGSLDSTIQTNNQTNRTLNYYWLNSKIQHLQNLQQEIKIAYKSNITVYQKYVISIVVLIMVLIMLLAIILHLRIKHLKNNYTTIQKNLQSKENDLRITLESISDGIIVTNRSGKILLINKAAQQLTGWDMDNAFKATLSEIFKITPRADDEFPQKKLIEQIQESCNTGLTHQSILKSKNGLHYQITYSASWIEKPGVLHDGIVIVFRDESEQFKMLEMLQRNEANLAAAEELAQLGSWEYDVRTKVMFWSDEVYRIFKISDMNFEPSYLQFIQLIHPDDQTVVKKYFNQKDLHPGKQSVDVRVLPEHGSEKIIRIRFNTVVDKSMEVERLVGSIQDITEISDLYKLLNEEFNLRTQLDNMVKSAKKQYKILFHNLPDMIFRVNENLICMAANRSFRRAYQLSNKDFYHKHLNQLPVSKELKELIVPNILQVFYDGDKRFLRVVHKIQNQKHFSKVLLVPEINEYGVASVFIMVSRGRSEWKKNIGIKKLKHEINLLAQKHQRRTMKMENILRREKKRTNDLLMRFNSVQAELLLQKDIIDAIPYPIYYTNTKNVIIHANLAFSQFLEYQDVGQLLGKNIYDIFPKHFAKLIDINHLDKANTGNTQISKFQLSNENRNTKNIISFRKKIDINIASESGMVGAIILYD